MDKQPTVIHAVLTPNTEKILEGSITLKEQEYIAPYPQKRRREFCAGRFALREILKRFGLENLELLPKIGKRYIQLPGCQVSIAHTDTYAVAIASNAPEILSLGVDIEDERREVISTLRERICIDHYDGEKRDPLEIFCIKEATFKALSPLLDGVPLSFKDARIQDDSNDHFEVSLVTQRVKDALQRASFNTVQLRGRLLATQGHFIAHVEARNGPFTAGALQF